jgi:hypothetical protein
MHKRSAAVDKSLHLAWDCCDIDGCGKNDPVGIQHLFMEYFHVVFYAAVVSLIGTGITSNPTSF